MSQLPILELTIALIFLFLICGGCGYASRWMNKQDLKTTIRENDNKFAEFEKQIIELRLSLDGEEKEKKKI